MRILARHWPLAAALAALMALVAALYVVSLSQNGGRLVYALDDAYIHMGVARNLVEHGVWGVTRYEFSSSSSSLLWTLLLAGVYGLFGASEVAPLVLNCLAAAGVIGLFYWILRRHIPDRPLAISAILLVVLFVTPLAPLVFAGMEHSLQVLISVAFLYAAAVMLSQDNQEAASTADAWAARFVLLLAPLVTMIRYEGMFLVATVCLLMTLRRMFAQVALVASLAALPIAIYGVVSIAHGWYFFPNSIILKGQTADLFSLGGALRFLLSGPEDTTLKIPRVFCLLGLGAVVYLLRSSRAGGMWRLHTVMIVVFATTALLHIQFAKVGWFYRYEAYLVAMFILVVSLSVIDDLTKRRVQLSWDLPRRHKVVSVVVCLGTLAVLGRAASAVKQTPEAMNDRYLEHVLVAQFVRDHYNDSVIVVNDIGAVAWYTDARMLDMFGLASREPIAFRRQRGGYTAQDVRDWAVARGARVAILQVMWAEVAPRIPKEWIEVGEWHLPRNVVFGDTRIGFFAVDPAARATLAADLSSFRSMVPPQVRQSGPYTRELARSD
jgi:hypothetical protein